MDARPQQEAETAPHCAEEAERCREAVFSRGLCRKHYSRRWRAGEYKGTPRPRKAPHICPEEHPHTYATCWLEHKCRCPRCKLQRDTHGRRAAVSPAKKKIYGLQDLRTGPMVPLAPVKAHLVTLQREGGFGLERIADAAKVSHALILALYFGRQGLAALGQDRDPRKQTMSADVAARILALQPKDIDPRIASALGSRRRLQSLVAIGYTPSYLANRIRVRDVDFTALLLGTKQSVTPRTAAAIRALFTELWLDPKYGAAADRMRAVAVARNWVGPLHWDDIDDPHEQHGADDTAVPARGHETSSGSAVA